MTAGEGSAPDDETMSDESSATTVAEGRPWAPALDASAAAPTSEADQLFDSPRLETPSAESADDVESEANDDVIAAVFGGSTPLPGGSRENEEAPEGAPVFIGGDPSTRFAAESLEEIARGIRAGEIMLPPIDPAADQSAVLAAVLAALLAPRR